MKKKILAVVLAVIIILTALTVIFYRNIEEYLINQAANPSGLVGKALTYIWNDYFKDMRRWGLDDIDFKEGSISLDVGCGGGEGINYMAGRTENGKVYGIDISQEAIDTTVSVNKKLIENKRVFAEVADVAELPYEDSKFDIVTAVQTHFYWDRLNDGFSEIYRVLKDDGLLVIISEQDKIDFHLEDYKSPESMKEFLSKIGFKDIEVVRKANWIKYICVK